MSTCRRSVLKSVSEKLRTIEDVLEIRLYALEPESANFGAVGWHRLKDMVRSLENCERFMKTLVQMPSSTSIERPPQLVSVFSIGRDLADHLRAVVCPGGAHGVVLCTRSRGRQILRRLRQSNSHRMAKIMLPLSTRPLLG